MCLHVINVFLISKIWILTSNVYCPSISAVLLWALSVSEEREEQFVTPQVRRKIKGVLWNYRPFKMHSLQEVSQFLPLKISSCIFLPVAATERDTASQQRNWKSVPGWKRLCVFSNNGRIKDKLLIMVLNTEENLLCLVSVSMCQEQLWFFSVSSITKWGLNEQETKQKWNPLHGDLSWRERQVSSFWEEQLRFLVTEKEKS